ncbi:MAG TPA: PfkB family carbohydrate kinase [Planctomycetota bacterium]|nr:PfkB family carbohydrate kinase [Planctomycetota bacterium]
MKPPRVVTLTLHPAIDRVVSIHEMRPGATFDARELLAIPAGKGVNTARVLRELCGASQRSLTAAWTGKNEERFFREGLRDLSGVHSAICPRACATRFAHTFLEDSGRETHIKEAMPAPSEIEERALLDFWRKTVRKGDVVAVCGSAPKKTRGSTLKKIFEIAHERGARAILADTNGAALIAAGNAGIELMKGNASEIGAWLGLREVFDASRADHRRALNRALNKSGAPKKLLITLGADGALFATAEKLLHGFIRKQIPARDIVSATGCGDAATAGVLWSMLESDTSDEELLARAIACGTAKLFSADPGKISLKRARGFVRYCLMKDIVTP